MANGPSDTDTGQAKKPKTPRKIEGPVKPKAPAKPKVVKPKAVKPKGAVPTKPVKPAAPQKPKTPAKQVAPKKASAVPPKKPAAPAKATKPGVPTKPAAPKTPSAAPKPAAPAPSAGRRRGGGRKKRTAAPAPAPAPQPKPSKAEQVKMQSEHDPLVGRTLGRCKIEELIGVGKTARVYRAHYEALDDVVAVKVLRTEVAKNPQLLERFQSEARAIAKVDNENVPKIYDVGEEGGLHYMVVELLEGEEIMDLISREGQVEIMDALRIVRQAANGLSAAHAHGLVHRDIKPHNLVLLEDGTVKVVDFGLAARFDESSERVGTPHYMAPEICESGNAELASDIYALGIVLYHLLVGNPPYAGQDIQGILKSHMKARPLRPEQHRQGGLNKEVADIVRSLTKRDALLRPTAQEVISALDEIGGKELKQKETLKSRKRRSRARAAVMRREKAGQKAPAMIGILVAVAVGVIAIVAMSGGDDPQPTPDADESASAPVKTDPAGLSSTPVEETEADRKARLERQVELRREKEAKEALERAHSYARNTWTSPTDTKVVRDQYSRVAKKYKGTSAGAKAKEIASEIKLKKRHPHPDREWSSQDAIKAARDQWAKDKSKAEELIAKHEYTGARQLVPADISDASGRLARELDWWRGFTQHLVDFQGELIKTVKDLPADEREIETPKGTGTLKRLSRTMFDIEVEGRSHSLAWTDMEPQQIARFAQSAFTAKDDARFLVLQLAYTFAHKLNTMFWDVELELGATDGSHKYSRETKGYTERARARMAK